MSDNDPIQHRRPGRPPLRSEAETRAVIVAAAANAFLKLLEEPNDLIHYIFLTRKLSQLLPTVRSRAQCYFLPAKTHILDAPNINPAIMSLAKRYLSANAQDLPKLAEALGVKGYRIDTPDELQSKLQEAFAHKGPALIDVRISKDERVYPTVPGGKALSDMIVGGIAR